MGILKTILIILIVYYSVRFISRLLVPIVLRMFMNRAQRNFQQQFGRFQQQQKPQKEGEVSIDSKQKNKLNSSGSSVGEYVDFEEVED
tara:strand:- start:175 stop:438 length:264 start_codon:yes stop_codon:yes gene_type:complete